jgi:ribosomal RNA assembly protein
MREAILIPKERIAVLIGKAGSARKKIERLTKLKLWIDTDTNEVSFNSSSADAIFFAKQVVTLVGRGFSPDSACKVLDDRYIADIVDVRDFGASQRTDRKRLLGRIIGTDGKTKRKIEIETNTEIVIYGKTVGILGKPEDVMKAKQAVEAVLSGSEQATAYRLLRDK